MDKFNIEPQCKKCLGKSFKTDYRHIIGGKYVGVLHRICLTCGYDWIEECADLNKEIDGLDQQGEE